MSVYLCGDLDPPELEGWLHHVRGALPEEQIDTSLDRLGADSVDIALVANPPPGSLQGLGGLKLIQSLWAGVDRLLADSTLPAGVPLARMVDPSMSAAMAETALWAVLALHRGFFAYARQQQTGEWRVLPQVRADERRVAVLGLGQLGTEVATRLAAQGFRVGAWRRAAASPAPAGIEVVDGPAGLAALLARCDIVVNLLPLTDDTRGLFDARRFAAMKPGAALVNLARGAHVVEADLIAALAAGQLSHAVLDVFSTEPLSADHPFWAHPQVTVLPHAAALTDPRSAALIVAANVRALRAGRPVLHLVERARGY